MTIGPAPMIRIDLMSVRLGIRSTYNWAQKKGALVARPSTPGGAGPARRVLRLESAGREGRRDGLSQAPRAGKPRVSLQGQRTCWGAGCPVETTLPSCATDDTTVIRSFTLCRVILTRALLRTRSSI